MVKSITYREASNDGKIITMRSNIRWYSDGFVFNRDNMAFAMDCCDHEIMSYTATAEDGIDSEMICDLIANSVLYRFGDIFKLLSPIH